ncbi:MAG: hypothetical protein WCT99_00495 [Bacteroidota bacterium]|jgi:hypothetical protein
MTRSHGITSFFFLMIHSLAPHLFVNNHFTAPPGKIGLLYGERRVYSLAMLITSEILMEARSLVIIDGANRLDPYLLARLARYKNIMPSDFLDRTYVTRAYTCYQLDISITDGLFEFLASVDAHIVVVYGLIDLFDDDQVPMADVSDILGRVRETLVSLKGNGISTLLVSSLPRFQLKEREKLFTNMTAMSDVRYRLEQPACSNGVLSDRTGRHDFSQHIILEENAYGANDTHGHHADSVRRKQLVTIPPGAAERRSRRF